MTSNSFILEATQENFTELVLDNSYKGRVLVDFRSPKAAPSLRQKDLILEPDDESVKRYRTDVFNPSY